MPQINAIHHIAIKCQDLLTMRNFYHEFLGLPLIRENTNSIWLDLGQNILMLEKTDLNRLQDTQQSPAQTPGLAVIAFHISVEEKALWLERLKKSQIQISHQSEFSIYFLDPEKNPLALSHFPAKVSKNE